MTSFYLQAGNPRFIPIVNPADDNVAAGMETVFPLFAESAYLVWDGVHVPLSYKYTVSAMINDIISMLEQVMRDDSGELETTWFVQEFHATWHMQWRNDELQIHAGWIAAPNYTLGLLVDRGSISVGRHDFISEWKMPLGIILKALRSAGYTAAMLHDMVSLERIYSLILKPGLIYQE